MQGKNKIFSGPMRSNVSKKIIVIGAGMSGLTASKILKQMGHRIKILESSDRVGGRIKTFRHPSGWTAELGAIQILDSHKLVHSLIRNYSLKTAPFRRSGSRNFLFMNSMRAREEKFHDEKNPFNLDFSEEEKQMTISELTQIFENAIADDLESMGWKKALHYMDGFSVKQYLEHCCNFSDAVVQQLIFCMNFEGLSYISMYEFVRMMFSFNDQNPTIVKDGLDNLPRKILQEIGKENILYNAKVHQISDRKSYSCVHYRLNSNSDRQVECSDYVIVATSIGIYCFYM